MSIDVFTTIKVVDGEPRYFHDHLKRLYSHASALGLDAPFIDLLTVQRYLADHEAMAGTWRLKLIITKQNGGVSIELTPYEPPLNDCFKIGIYPEPVEGPFSRFKTLANSARLQIKNQALSEGLDDYLTVNRDGFLLEGSYSNVFWIKDKSVFTPSRELPLLDGITLRKVQEYLLAMGYRFEEVKTKQIPAGSYCYLCNSMMGVVPVIEIKGQEMPKNIRLGSILAK